MADKITTAPDGFHLVPWHVAWEWARSNPREWFWIHEVESEWREMVSWETEPFLHLHHAMDPDRLHFIPIPKEQTVEQETKPAGADPVLPYPPGRVEPGT